MKYNGPKVRLSRALGIPLTAKAARIMEQRGYPPGEHGRNQRVPRKMSDYKRQLLEKQRLRAQYNIHERQMRTYVRRATQKSGNTADNLVQLLEMRLDAVVLRGGLAKTIYAARQYVSHGHILVNGRRINVPAYTCKVGDVISVKLDSRQLPCFQEAVDDAMPAPYVTLDKGEMSVRVTDVPSREQAPIICEVPLVIEFYSR